MPDLIIAFGIFFLFFFPIRGYLKGREQGLSAQCMARGLILGGVLFFVLMQMLAYLEMHAFYVAGSSADFSGVIPHLLSFLGALVAVIGILMVFVY